MIKSSQAGGSGWRKFTAKAGALSGFFLAALLATAGSPSDAPGGLLQAEPNISLRHEVEHTIDTGLAWLAKNQNPTNGSWSSAEHPALTAMVVSAFKGRPGKEDAAYEDAVKKGYAFLLTCVQTNGGIYHEDLPSYNTSVVLMALLLDKQNDYRHVIANGRNYLIGLQKDYPESGDGDTNALLNGGIGYGGPLDKVPDLSNTLLVMESLYYTKNIVDDKGGASPDLNWKAAIHFVQSCQNLPSHNPAPWASDDPQNKGGFIYSPGRSPAGSVTNLATGRVALRSYGSMSYAGMLSYIYADLKPDDPRVAAVVQWLKDNYTLDENPGMGAQGIYYYYFAMTKALTLYGADKFDTKSGSVNWREQLTLKLMNLQHTDGSWYNDTNRWWEKDPVLGTAYALLSLEIIDRKL
jgi:squalene-hopene/tetraprenyl-beta-curcumene cyclase